MHVCRDNPQNETIPVQSSSDKSDDDILIETLRLKKKQHSKSLFFAHINVNSLGNKRDYFRDILSHNLIDVLCVSETKLCDEYVYTDFHVDGYRVHRKDRSQASGGLLVWVRSDLPHHRDSAYEFPEIDCHVESMVLNFTIKKEQWFLVVTYKNPRTSSRIFVDLLSNTYQSLFRNGTVKEVILMGDVNIDMMDRSNIMTNELCDIYGLTNVISEPTCYKSSNGTLIDPIIVVNSQRFYKSINVKCGHSDWHNLTCCITKLTVKKSKPRMVKYRSYKNFDSTLFVESITQVPFQVCEIFDDVSDRHWCATKMYVDVLNEHAPEKKRLIKTTQVPYMNSDLRKQMYRRSMARNKYVKNRNHQTWSSYVAERNKTTSMRKQAIRSYFLQRCNNMTRPSDFWDCVKPFLANKSVSSDNIMLNEDSNIVIESEEVCNIFNKFFAAVASEIGEDDSIDVTETNWFENALAKHQNHPSIHAIKNSCTSNHVFNFKEVSSEKVSKYLKGINPKKATGFDGIPPSTVKSVHNVVAQTLTSTFNECLNSMNFPETMKYAEIAPVHKKNNEMDKANYRPVSILTTFSKTFETIIADQLVEHFHNLFNEMLCAYRKKYSPCHTLVKLVESWKQALDDRQCVGALLMDLSKAFDSVPHGLLICKLRAYGLSEAACRLMGSYLSGRKQRVKIDVCRSEWSSITKGIPQGSCLGPVIFNIFMNDIFHFIKRSQLSNYADDNTLSVTAASIDLITTALTSDANAAIEWFTSNFLQVNPQKFQMMYMMPLTSGEDVPELIVINNAEIPTQTEVKLLGITIDNKLNFDTHIDTICRKASRQLNVLRRFKGTFQLQELKTIYQAFIMSNFNYCPIVWHFCSVKSMRKMEKIQERAVRLMYDDTTTPYQTLLTKHDLKTLHVQRIKTIAMEVFKSLYDLNPPFMKELFQLKTLAHDLRDKCKLIQPQIKTIRYGRNSFSYYGAHLWNILPRNLKLICDIDNFKFMLRSWEGPKCRCSLCSFSV